MNSNFRHISNTSVLDGEIREYKHADGARIFHLKNSDREKAFSIAFPTPPDNNSGVAHILEHVVLCGSKRFPVHDPFFSMLHRGVHTFMNACTADDFTCYLAATQDQLDFENLLSVYLDAVFAPLLRKESFLQEGWRLAPGPKLGGVVYNEMKGAYSSIDHRLSSTIQYALFPDNHYSYDSAGAPKHIPTLTHEKLKAFYAEHYRPSRAIVYLYGNLSLSSALEQIEPFLKDSGEIVPFKPTFQPRFSAPRALQNAFPGIEETRIAIAFLTCSRSDLDQIALLSLLDILLMGHEGSPLKRALLEIPGCQSVESQLDMGMSEVSYSIICRGELSSHIVWETIRETLEKINRFPTIESALKQYELGQRVKEGGKWPHPLKLFFRHIAPAFHGVDPAEALHIEKRCKNLREGANDKTLLQLIDKHILNNPHRALITMESDPKLGASEVAAEREMLSRIEGEISELPTWQGSEEVLPLFPLTELTKEGQEFPLQRKNGILHHSCYASGLSYASLVVPLPPLSKEESDLLPIMLAILPHLGCSGLSADERMRYLETHTAGINAHSLVIGKREYAVIEGHSLDRDQKQLMNSLVEMGQQIDWGEKKRIEEELYKLRSDLHNTLAEDALTYAVADAIRMLGLKSRGVEIITNLEKALSISYDAAFAALHKKVFSSSGEMVLSSNEVLGEFTASEGIAALVEGAKFEESRIAKWLEAPVSYTVRAFKVTDRKSTFAAPLSLLTPLCRRLVLHPRIREQGGAYGSGGRYLGEKGILYFFTYRDPHVNRSLAAFEEAIELVGNGNFSELDLHQAKLAAYQDLDKPTIPGERAMKGYRWEKDSWNREQRQKLREGIRNCTKEEIVASIAQLQRGVTVTYGGRELLEREGITAHSFAGRGLAS